jgi:putative flippase GtrA
MAAASRFPFRSTRARLENAWRHRALSLKAASFAVIGLANTVVDFGVFLLARVALERSATALAVFAMLADDCHCGTPQTVLLIAANVMSWAVAVSGSYVMNSWITFAAETGRKLRLSAYLAFIVSGIAGLIANAAVLVFAAQILALPILLAKVLAILASFIVNFLMSHFVVFRTHGAPAGESENES